MSKFVILLNGPAGSGKDTVADMMAHVYSGNERVQRLAFKDELYRKTAEHFQVDLVWFKEVATDRVLKEEKNSKILLDGAPISPRHALIHVSEYIIKPLYGKGYFGACLAARLKDGINIVSDSGFYEETLEVLQATPVGTVIVVNIERGDLTFVGDSRYEITKSGLREFCGKSVEYLGMEYRVDHTTFAKFKNEQGNYLKMLSVCLEIYSIINEIRLAHVSLTIMEKYGNHFSPQMSQMIEESINVNLPKKH